MANLKMIVSAIAILLSICSTADARFVQTDPAGYQDSLDLYTYVQDDPANKTDSTGLLAGDVALGDALGGASATSGLGALATAGARAEAGAARAAGAEGGAAGAIATSDGKVFAGSSTRAGGPSGATNPKVQQALDRVSQQSKFHGHCCEINALSNALNAARMCVAAHLPLCVRPGQMPAA